MSGGRVVFAGCGPGAEDLLTLRAVRALGSADIVVWNAGLLGREALAAHTRHDVEVVQWPPATARDVVAVFDRALAEDLIVVRLSGGDPMLFGGLRPELAAVRDRGLALEVVPGISAVAATAAARATALAEAGAPLLLVDAATLVQAPPSSPGRVAVHSIGGAAGAGALQRALLERGLAAETRCTIAVEVSRRDELFEECPLGELAETVEDLGSGMLTLVLATSPESPRGPRSRARDDFVSGD